jgi:hypothetical protein
MKKIMMTVLLSTMVTFSYSDKGGDDFCDGWEDGWKDGWCYERFGCIPRIAPLCPLKRLHENTYKDGYNRGFKAAIYAR